MDDLMLLERLEKALDAPPTVELSASKDWPPVEEVRANAESAIRRSKEWLKNVTDKIAKARKHDPDRKLFLAIWPQLEPHIGKAIRSRESVVREMDAILDDISRSKDHDRAELLEVVRRMNTYAVSEHRALVDLYYLLKADADNASPDTRGHGKALSSSDDLRAYFKRIRAA